MCNGGRSAWLGKAPCAAARQGSRRRCGAHAATYMLAHAVTQGHHAGQEARKRRATTEQQPAQLRERVHDGGPVTLVVTQHSRYGFELTRQLRPRQRHTRTHGTRSRVSHSILESVCVVCNAACGGSGRERLGGNMIRGETRMTVRLRRGPAAAAGSLQHGAQESNTSDHVQLHFSVQPHAPATRRWPASHYHRITTALHGTPHTHLAV